MAKSKSALGKKINFVHNAITQKRLGEETSQIGFEKMFKPVTSKLDDVMGPSAASNLPRPKSNPHEGRKPIWKELIISPTSIHLKIWMLKVCLTKLFRPKLRNKFQRVLRQVMTK